MHDYFGKYNYQDDDQLPFNHETGENKMKNFLKNGINTIYCIIGDLDHAKYLTGDDYSNLIADFLDQICYYSHPNCHFNWVSIPFIFKYYQENKNFYNWCKKAIAISMYVEHCVAKVNVQSCSCYWCLHGQYNILFEWGKRQKCDNLIEMYKAGENEINKKNEKLKIKEKKLYKKLKYINEKKKKQTELMIQCIDNILINITTGDYNKLYKKIKNIRKLLKDKNTLNVLTGVFK